MYASNTPTITPSDTKIHMIFLLSLGIEVGKYVPLTSLCHGGWSMDGSRLNMVGYRSGHNYFFVPGGNINWY